MRISTLLTAVAIAFAVAGPGIAAARSPLMVAQAASSMNPQQIQTAVKTALESAHLTLRQKLKVKPVVDDYKSQTAGADAATKKMAQEALLKKIYGVLTPDQQTRFKASLRASMVDAASH
jgi:hypothetical protein